MNYRHIFFDEYNVDVALSAFEPSEGVHEYNAMLRGTMPTADFYTQLRNIEAALDALIASINPSVKPVLIRYMLSDATNQASFIRKDYQCAVSVIGQPPLDGTKVALWVYLLSDIEIHSLDWGIWEASHGHYSHLWKGSAGVDTFDSQAATISLLNDYSQVLNRYGCTLADNCQRTWFFVRDVDVNYAGVVKGRNQVFDREGLTTKTHFIASTGISGNNPDPKISVTMDAYAVKGIEQAQISYLKASDFLNPTAEYGVAFERGTALCYGDRRHLLISGTASINNRGEVVHKGDIIRQTERMLQNIEALVREGECSMADITHMIIYLRDIADFMVVNDFFNITYPDVPKVIVLAPVCRPGWLIEVECMAINDKGNKSFHNY